MDSAQLACRIHTEAAGQAAVQDILVGQAAQDSHRTATTVVAVGVQKGIHEGTVGVAAVDASPAVADRPAAVPGGGLVWSVLLAPYAVAVVCRAAGKNSARVLPAQRHASCYCEHAWSHQV